jgi:hypothetical protein
MQQMDSPVLPQQLLDRVVFGHVIPPEMQWANLFEHMIPQLLSASVPLSLEISPFIQLKRSWESAFVFDKEEDWFAPNCLFIKSKHRTKCSPRRISLIKERSLEEKKDDPNELDVTFEATPLKAKQKRARKVVTPLVQSEDRRFTRSCLKNGYRPAPVVEVQPKKKARGRAKLLVVQPDTQQEDSSAHPPSDGNHSDGGDGFIRTPATPLHVLQRIGRQLGIAEEKLTKDKLEAAPKTVDKGKSDDV